MVDPTTRVPRRVMDITLARHSTLGTHNVCHVPQETMKARLSGVSVAAKTGGERLPASLPLRVLCLMNGMPNACTRSVHPSRADNAGMFLVEQHNLPVRPFLFADIHLNTYLLDFHLMDVIHRDLLRTCACGTSLASSKQGDIVRGQGQLRARTGA